MKKAKCPVCYANLEKAREIHRKGKKYLFLRCTKCIYEETILLHKQEAL
jgi:uncharacterized Zn finger protein